MWLLLHGPRHPLDDAALQPILEAVDQALRPADQDVGVRAQLLVGPSQNVSEVGPRADGREHVHETSRWRSRTTPPVNCAYFVRHGVETDDAARDEEQRQQPDAARVVSDAEHARAFVPRRPFPELEALGRRAQGRQ